MIWIREHWLILILLALYTAVMVYHAWLGNRQTKGLVDYYVGGRSIGGFAIGISFFATYSSTNSFVGFSGQAYDYGLAWLLLVPFAVIFSVMAWVWIAPRLREFTESLDSVTIPDFIGFRFGSKSARVLAALIVLFASFLYMTAVYKGIGNLFEAILEIPYWVAILLVLIIVMVYTSVGGFHSVVKTDVIQGMIMILAAVMLFSGIARAAGGIDSFFAVGDKPQTARLLTWNAAMPLPLVLGILFAGMAKLVVEPRQLSRFYGLKDRLAARKGMWVSTLTFLLVYAMLVPIGIYAHQILPEGITDTDLVVPALLGKAEVFHYSVSAFLFLAMVAAAMSSLDSVLLVMASTCVRDLIEPWWGMSSEKRALRSTRFYVALFAVITALIAFNPPGGIVAMTAFSGSLYAACFMPAIVLGLYWRRGNGKAVVASYAAGLACLFFWKHVPLSSVIHQVFAAVFLSIITYLIVALSTTPNDSENVRRLFASKRYKLQC